MEDEKLTDIELAAVLGFDTTDELISAAKVLDGAPGGSVNDTLYIQTCAGVWTSLNSPNSRWAFHQDEEWE